MRSSNPYKNIYENINQKNENLLHSTLLSGSVLSNFDEKYPSLNPSKFIESIKSIHNCEERTEERVQHLAKTLEGFDYYNRIKISQIKESFDSKAEIPCIQNNSYDRINTIHQLNWLENDLNSEYLNGKLFKNHIMCYDGLYSSSSELCFSYFCGSSCCYLYPILLILGLIMGLIYLFVGNWMGLLYFFICFIVFLLILIPFLLICYRSEKNIYDIRSKGDHDEIQSEIVQYYNNIIFEMNNNISRYFPEIKSTNIQSFAKFLDSNLFQILEKEIINFFQRNDFINLSKDVFEDYLMIYRFYRYRYNHELDFYDNKMIRIIISCIFESNQELSNYLLDLFDNEIKIGFYNLKKIDICNIIGISNKNIMINLIKQIKNFNDEKRFNLIKYKIT